jgi:hypothetical protein
MVEGNASAEAHNKIRRNKSCSTRRREIPKCSRSLSIAYWARGEPQLGRGLHVEKLREDRASDRRQSISCVDFVGSAFPNRDRQDAASHKDGATEPGPGTLITANMSTLPSYSKQLCVKRGADWIEHGGSRKSDAPRHHHGTNDGSSHVT